MRFGILIELVVGFDGITSQVQWWMEHQPGLSSGRCEAEFVVNLMHKFKGLVQFYKIENFSGDGVNRGPQKFTCCTVTRAPSQRLPLPENISNSGLEGSRLTS